MNALARSARRLSSPEWLAVFDTVAHLFFVFAALRLLPFRVGFRLLSRKTAAQLTGAVDASRLAAIVDAIMAVFRAPCLVRALVLQRLLAGRGYGSSLVVGASLTCTQFKAHAWLERAGRTVIGSCPDTYVPLVRFSSDLERRAA